MPNGEDTISVNEPVVSSLVEMVQQFQGLWADQGIVSVYNQINIFLPTMLRCCDILVSGWTLVLVIDNYFNLGFVPAFLIHVLFQIFPCFVSWVIIDGNNVEVTVSLPEERIQADLVPSVLNVIEMRGYYTKWKLSTIQLLYKGLVKLVFILVVFFFFSK